jgi:flagellar biosynthesis protein FlhF
LRLQTFRGRDISTVSKIAREVLGEDAMIVKTRVIAGRPAQVEVTAVPGTDVDRLNRRMESAPLPDRAGRDRPLVLALVGPTGSGKTTTLAKLALHPAAFGGRKVGLLTLDTFRTGALEQLESYAGIAGLPLEVVYTLAEVGPAMARLAGCDVVLVDTPGRSPRSPERNAAWMEMLRAAAPDEVHLVVPAPLRLEVAVGSVEAYEGAGVSHFLLSKLDEVPGDWGVADLAVELRLRTRWITDGQEIPLDLHPACPRILGLLAGYTGGLAAERLSA